MEFLAVLMFWFAFAIITAIVASAKGRSGFLWLILGTVFGVFAFLVIIVIPSLKAQRIVMANGEPIPTPKTHVRCPDCAELVLKQASKCKHCGCVLIPQ